MDDLRLARAVLSDAGPAVILAWFVAGPLLAMPAIALLMAVMP